MCCLCIVCCSLIVATFCLIRVDVCRLLFIGVVVVRCMLLFWCCLLFDVCCVLFGCSGFFFVEVVVGVLLSVVVCCV